MKTQCTLPFRFMMVTIFSLSLAGCGGGNPFITFYKPSKGYETQQPQAAQEVKSAEVILANDFKRDSKALYEKGYLTVGQAAWEGPDVDPNLALDQANAVGAEIVLVGKNYVRTHSGSVPLTMPSTTYSTTNFNVGGTYGSAQTSTHGTSTTYIPYDVDRYNYDAAFWRKRTKPPILGLVSVKLAEEDRRRYERNKGVAVHALLTNGPAYNAGILEDDVIIAIGMDEISDVDHFKTTLRKYEGQMVELTVLRAGKQRTVPVQLNQSAD